jgi:hypothetical protein
MAGARYGRPVRRARPGFPFTDQGTLEWLASVAVDDLVSERRDGGAAYNLFIAANIGGRQARECYGSKPSKIGASAQRAAAALCLGVRTVQVNSGRSNALRLSQVRATATSFTSTA